MKRIFPAVAATALAAAVAVGAPAQSVTRALPLDNLGLEHLDIIVPDPAASARFYARIFKAPLYQQPVRDTLRYFVVLGEVPADRQVCYVAIGTAGGRQPAIGNYCVLATVYDRAGMRVCFLPMKPFNDLPRTTDDPASGSVALHFRGKRHATGEHRKDLMVAWDARHGFA